MYDAQRTSVQHAQEVRNKLQRNGLAAQLGECADRTELVQQRSLVLVGNVPDNYICIVRCVPSRDQRAAQEVGRGREEIEGAFPAAASVAVTPVHLDGRIIDESDNHSASGAEDTAGEMFADSAALMKARQLHAAGDITSVQLAMLIQKEREFLYRFSIVLI